MSLYLKYRPHDFINLVGQSFIKNTLQKAIENKKTVGAYLLCGPRGTGKTSTARIFAKAVNCKNPSKGNPCLKCEICIGFSQEKLIDIIEIDAASHTGVDNIREIIEKAQFSPTQTEYKIYIIDEVHMLSKGAFNALLKILEEPPKHVKFILATTETHKVPETIISRCQRYDFKRISDIDIKNRLLYIAKEESIKIDENSISYIIKNSSGGLRNAISLFEQLVTNGEITYSHIVEKLEIVSEETVKDFLIKLINKDSSVISIFEKNISDGKNMKLFFKELLFFTKDEALKLLKKGENILEYIKILEILDETYSKTKYSLDENTTFIIGILKILKSEVLNDNSIKLSSKNNSLKLNTDSSKIKSHNINPMQNTDCIENKKINTEKKEELSPQDGAEIFGENIETESKDINSSFNVEQFILNGKKHGAKGGLTMALRGVKIELFGNDLNIGVKTKMAKAQVENLDNIAIMTKSLSDMGYSNISIKIK